MAVSLADAASRCLAAHAIEDKVARTFATAASFARGELTSADDAQPPEPIRMPARPPTPRLVHPRDLPKRGL
ncbi:MAG: DUF455 domain-containing protein, partial [Luteimonas sp.]